MKSKIKHLLMMIALLILIYILYQFLWIPYKNKITFEKETITLSESIQNSPFSISKVLLYSSAHGENQNTNFQQSNWILNILQYTDIAIYLNHAGETLNSSNTIQKLSLENIAITAPNLGSPSLYYLDSLNFGTANFNQNDKLENTLEFTILNDENKHNDIQSNTPVFFTDCSNPITLKYVNSSVKENYAITSHEPIFFDGHLLQIANISLENLETTISFTIHIESNNHKNYFCHVSLPISLKNETSSIYDGNILMEKKLENYKFIETQ